VYFPWRTAGYGNGNGYNGVITSDLNGSGTGTCSGGGRAYVNGVGQ